MASARRNLFHTIQMTGVGGADLAKIVLRCVKDGNNSECKMVLSLCLFDGHDMGSVDLTALDVVHARQDLIRVLNAAYWCFEYMTPEELEAVRVAVEAATE